KGRNSPTRLHLLAFSKSSRVFSAHSSASFSRCSSRAIARYPSSISASNLFFASSSRQEATTLLRLVFLSFATLSAIFTSSAGTLTVTLTTCTVILFLLNNVKQHHHTNGMNNCQLAKSIPTEVGIQS